MAPYFGL